MKIEKIGRKYYHVTVNGKKSTYAAELVITAENKGYVVGQEIEVDAKFEDLSTKFGKKYRFHPLSTEQAAEENARISAEIAKKEAEKKAKDAENRKYYNDIKIKKYIGFVENAAKSGYISHHYVAKLKELGAWTDELKERIYVMKDTAVAAEKAEKAAEDAKYTNIWTDEKHTNGMIIRKNGKIYEVISSKYVHGEDACCYGGYGDHGYTNKCIDITDTDNGAKILAQDAAENAAKAEKAAELAKIKALMKEIEEKGQKITETINMPKGDVIYDTFNNYGGGEKIIRTNDGTLYYIKNNGADGGFWGHNTIRTGGAGAYGLVLTAQSEQKYEKMILQTNGDDVYVIDSGAENIYFLNNGQMGINLYDIDGIIDLYENDPDVNNFETMLRDEFNEMLENFADTSNLIEIEKFIAKKSSDGVFCPYCRRTKRIYNTPKNRDLPHYTSPLY